MDFTNNIKVVDSNGIAYTQEELRVRANEMRIEIAQRSIDNLMKELQEIADDRLVSATNVKADIKIDVVE